MSGGNMQGRFGRLRRMAISACLVLAGAFALTPVSPAGPALAANPCGPPVVSVIACENSLPGDPPSDWQVSGSGDSSIQGFATAMSVNAGENESFKIKTNASSYHLNILRDGYSQGNRAHNILAAPPPTPSPPHTHPPSLP